MRAHLILKDGTVFKGRSPLGFGGSGELVSVASMTGYQEILTDPSFFGQLVAMTFPEQGIYGIHDSLHESRQPWAKGLLCRRLTSTPDHIFAETDVGTWLKRHRVPVMTELDTRALAHCLRDRGLQPAIIWTEADGGPESGIQKAAELPGLESQPLCAMVSCKERWEQPHSNRKFRVAVLDGGIKSSVLRLLHDAGLHLEIFPWDAPASELLAERFNGVFLSSGPGDPAALTSMHHEVAALIGKKPIFGLGLGHQLLAHAFGAGTYKMPLGHRGSNQPVVTTETNRVEITAQSHGFAVMENTLPSDLHVTHRHLSDETVEGMRHAKLPIFSLEYIPRAATGMTESKGSFDFFVEMMVR
jgi:carbamoyl-phosphate synthase small subunit